MKLEDYLQRTYAEPQEEPEPEENLPKVHPLAATFGALDENDRDWLKRLQNEPGYLILFKMLNNIVLSYERSATVQSQGDPLGNKDAVANAWAYASIGRHLRDQLLREIATEIAKL
jgi:hypothetical protein